jgi:hypothetical protein
MNSTVSDPPSVSSVPRCANTGSPTTARLPRPAACPSSAGSICCSHLAPYSVLLGCTCLLLQQRSCLASPFRAGRTSDPGIPVEAESGLFPLRLVCLPRESLPVPLPRNTRAPRLHAEQAIDMAFQFTRSSEAYPGVPDNTWRRLLYDMRHAV